MANHNGDTWGNRNGDLEQPARVTPTETNNGLFYPGRSDSLIPGCADHSGNDNNSLNKKTRKRMIENVFADRCVGFPLYIIWGLN